MIDRDLSIVFPAPSPPPSSQPVSARVNKASLSGHQQETRRSQVYQSQLIICFLNAVLGLRATEGPEWSSGGHYWSITGLSLISGGGAQATWWHTPGQWPTSGHHWFTPGQSQWPPLAYFGHHCPTLATTVLFLGQSESPPAVVPEYQLQETVGPDSQVLGKVAGDG